MVPLKDDLRLTRLDTRSADFLAKMALNEPLASWPQAQLDPAKRLDDIHGAMTKWGHILSSKI